MDVSPPTFEEVKSLQKVSRELGPHPKFGQLPLHPTITLPLPQPQPTMGLSDFERELAEDKSTRDSNHNPRDEGGERKHGHRHHHRSHRHRDRDEDEERRRRHKRHRDRQDDGKDEEGRRHRRKRRRSSREEATTTTNDIPAAEVKVFDSDIDDNEDEWVEKEAATAPPQEDIQDQRDTNLRDEKVQRDAWMQEPSALDIDYVASRKPKAPPSQFVGAKANHEFKVHAGEVGSHLRDLERDLEDSDQEAEKESGVVEVKDEPAQHEVNYTFGDAGSAWRMQKLRNVYRLAEEAGKGADAVAMEKYGDLRLFDDAREEEREMDRRKMYGKEYVGLEKPSGEFFQERKMKAGIHRAASNGAGKEGDRDLPQGLVMSENQITDPPKTTAALDPTALNKLKAQLMKAKLRNAPNLAKLEEEYRLTEEASLANSQQPDVVVLNTMENRHLASGREGEVTHLSGKRARHRGLVTEADDMTIEDMVRQERRNARGAGAGSGRELAERIAKDGKFVDDLDYMDDNAEKLSKKVVKTDSQLRNTAIDDFSRMKRVLDSCPLCHHEDAATPQDQMPVAPVVSLATRTYLTLPTEPEIVKNGGGAVIVPIQHRLNLLECDEDEWEEMRNFMKSLTRFYDSQDKGVLFYENAAHFTSRKGHAAMYAVPLPRHLVDTAPAYFKEAILSADEQWSQHKPIIDTLALSRKPGGFGKAAFRKSMVSNLPYFHVWFSLDGGMGHVIEDERRWPKGDLFAREVIGGMVDAGPERVKRQGRWERGDRRVEGFRKAWGKWDWTRALVDAQ